ncbi:MULTISPECIES: hypothetical protein [Sulfurimonas]|uniref:Uncharacterized protein n=1 Tax=Sulfurimonas diazotrophicus TaxID=3131939 RepID=A0ABZ3HA12_9BACT
MKSISLALSALAAGLIFAACGGSGSSSTGRAVTSITGTVPGTLIEAFCEDGSYYAVNSNDNGTSEHPFEIEVPQNTSCRLVMTTNENTPDASVVTLITLNGSSLFEVNATAVDLGYIALPMDRTGYDDDNNGVADDLFNVVTPEGTVISVELADDPMDVDGDGVINLYDDDDDNDGIKDDVDPDDDNDGIPDTEDEDSINDFDHDGINNDADIDDDNDKIIDAVDNDDDNDGIDDSADTDDDNDGIDDSNDPDQLNDTDHDGLTDAYDDDDDNDGIPDDEDPDDNDDGIDDNETDGQEVTLA